MNLNQFLILALLAIGLKPWHASGFDALQDSTKKVAIVVTATEKPREMNFDSLLKARSPKVSQATEKRFKSGVKSSTNSAANRQRKQNAVRQYTGTVQKSAERTQPRAEQPVEKTSTTKAEESQQETAPNISQSDTIISGAQIIDDSDLSTGPDDKASRTYLWVGCMLMVAGIILAILFGKTALLISIAGIIFAIISYTIRD